MAGGNHNTACANARGYTCKCTGCGGSLHGWQGWIDLADAAPEVREHRRGELEGRAKIDARTQQMRATVGNRRLCVDLIRLDIADYLYRDNLRRQTVGKASDSDLSEPDAPHESTSDRDWVVELAERIMGDTWQAIASELDQIALERGAAAKKIKGVKAELASHTWCDLLVGVIRLIEDAGEIVDELAEEAKNFVRDAIQGSTRQGWRAHVTRTIVDLVLDRAWPAFTRVALAVTLPVLDTTVLRALRMLAVFACPDPERHSEVRCHALIPLLADGLGIVTEETKRAIGPLLGSLMKHGPEADAPN